MIWWVDEFAVMFSMIGFMAAPLFFYYKHMVVGGEGRDKIWFLRRNVGR